MGTLLTKTFHCLYCDTTHSFDCHAEEHIIPEFLLNKNYVLKNTCRKINNYMAHAFEKRINQIELIKEILLFFKPPNKPVYRGEANVPVNAQIHRYILPNGQDELVEHPKCFTTDSIEIPINTESGLLKFDLKLPFEIVNEIKSIPRMAIDRNKHHERGREKIIGYLKKLAENPSINKDFETYLKKVNGKFFFKDVVVSEQKYDNEKIEIPEQQTYNYDVDLELMFKLFLKIAWTHSAKSFGVDWTSEHLSRWIINYLSSGHINNNKYYLDYPELFFEPKKIDEDEYVFWKLNINDSFDFIQAIPITKDRNELLDLHNLRFNDFNLACQLISYSDASEFYISDKSQKENLQYHELSFDNSIYGEGQMTICSIKLFGGLFEAEIQIAPYAIRQNYSEPFRINF